MSFESLELTDRLALLRAYSLCFIRLNQATIEEKNTVIAKLDSFYPAQNESLNTELSRVLGYLDSPNVVKKTIGLMKRTETKTLAYDKEMLERSEYGRDILNTMSNTPNSQNIHYAYSLRQTQNGWTLEDRKYYFSWLNETLEKSGGKSFTGHIRAIRTDAINHLPPEEAATVSWLLGDIATVDLSTLPKPQGPPVIWTTDTAMELFEEPLQGRSYQSGKKMFSAGACVACHRFDGSGGYAGPDLGSVGNRYSIRDILVSICEPSNSISEQYQASAVTLKDGNSAYGRIIYKNDEELAVASNPYALNELIKLPIETVAKVEPSNVSLMPPGMIFGMNQDELMDLVAYLVSSGNRKHEVFNKE